MRIQKSGCWVSWRGGRGGRGAEEGGGQECVLAVFFSFGSLGIDIPFFGGKSEAAQKAVKTWSNIFLEHKKPAPLWYGSRIYISKPQAYSVG